MIKDIIWNQTPNYRAQTKHLSK